MFSPSILRSASADPVQLLQDTKHATTFLTRLVESEAYLFDDERKQLSINHNVTVIGTTAQPLMNMNGAGAAGQTTQNGANINININTNTNPISPRTNVTPPAVPAMPSLKLQAQMSKSPPPVTPSSPQHRPVPATAAAITPPPPKPVTSVPSYLRFNTAPTPTAAPPPPLPHTHSTSSSTPSHDSNSYGDHEHESDVYHDTYQTTSDNTPQPSNVYDEYPSRDDRTQSISEPELLSVEDIPLVSVDRQDSLDENDPTTQQNRLPTAWVALVDDDGNTYYYNKETQISQWEYPTGT